MSRSRRAPRGNGAELYEDPDGGQIDDDDPENAVVIVDNDGNPIDDDFALTTDDDPPDDPIEPDDNDDPVAALERNFSELQKQHQTVTQERDTYRQQAETSRTGEVEATKAAISQAKTTIEGRISAAERAIEEAGDAQDFKALAKAQGELADARYDLRDLGNIQKQFEDGLTAEPVETRKAPPANDQPFAKKVDAYIGNLSTEQQKFAKKYRDKIFPEGDQKPLQKVLALSNVARDVKGFEVDSPEFFDYIEKEMGLSEPKTPKAKPTPQRRPNAAPVRRGGQISSAQVHLSQAELKMAKRLGMSPKKYGLHKHTAMSKANDPDYSGPRYSKDDPAIVGSKA